MRLSAATLDLLPPHVERPAYDRESAAGIVHFGIGAFHRAHQAWYSDACLRAGGTGWMIAGVSLRSAGVARQLDPQDGLFTVVERSASGEKARVAGSVGKVLVAGADDASIVAQIADPACRIISFTVTEKGYCRGADGSLDMDAAMHGFYPLLAAGMRARKDAGLPGLTLLSCDNLAHNGHLLRQLLHQYLPADMQDWFEAECTCPSSMVDRIVPATTPDDLARLEASFGLKDEGAVFTEEFSQWVIEDNFAGPRPRWEDHGAQIVEDVTPYETAKLRMLNGAHSLMAYCGLEAGHEFVHQAIDDPDLRQLVDRLMRQEAATSFSPAPGQDLADYADALVARFRNPSLNHRLAQIAMDGSQKIPQRWLETFEAHRNRGNSCPAMLQGLAAWVRHIRGDLRPVDDPEADSLAELWQNAGKAGIARALFGPNGRFDVWKADESDLNALTEMI